jgi:apolipoprotein N-acyltransferase
MRIGAIPRAFLVALSAGLQIVIFPLHGPLPTWRSWLAWIALAPLLVAIVARDRAGRMPNLWQSALWGYVCGVLFYAGNCYWIYQTMYLYAGVSKPAALGLLLLFSLYLGLYHALFGLLLRLAAAPRQRAGIALAASPFLWIAVELARAHITSFPWDQLGMSQIDNAALTAWAPLGGVYVISFVLAVINAALVYVLMRRRLWRAVLIAAVLAVACFAPLRGNHRVLWQPQPQRAVLLQPNALEGDDAAWMGDGYPRQMREFSALSEHPPLGLQDGGADDVVVWPESPSPLFEQDARFQADAADLAKVSGAPLILGDIARASENGQTAVYNSASFFTSQGTPAGRYDKIHLVPFGEYVPFKEFFSFAGGLTANVGTMTSGRLRVMFSTNGHTYGVFICYESIFADEVRQLAKNGAGVLVNISDDGWYGDTSAPWQHLNMARMRAIENRRWLLRDTNNGVTAAIDPMGKIVASAPRHTLTAIRVPFAFTAETTFYTRHGDWFAYMCCLLALAMLFYAQYFSTNKSPSS